MGSKNKLKRFKDNEKFENVIQPQRHEVVSNDFKYKGCWNENYFNNKNPLVVELGCGKGEYTVGLAQRFPEKNFIDMSNPNKYDLLYSYENSFDVGHLNSIGAKLYTKMLSTEFREKARTHNRVGGSAPR